MKKFSVLTLMIILFISLFALKNKLSTKEDGAPPYALEDLTPPEVDPYEWLNSWKRPEGPAKVGLQVGHWKNNELPDELERLRGNTGASGGGKNEWEVNLAIAEETKKILLNRNIIVDILSSTIPNQYWADVFVAIHADGSTDKTASGFKVASPRRDYSGNAGDLVENITSNYSSATGLSFDDNISRNMTGYYVFAWWRYDHAIHPKTASAILETGFLTNPSDRKIILNKPQISAQGLAEGIIEYLSAKELI